MKKILVTGGNGFIGSHMLEALNKEEYEVWATCRNKTSEDFKNKINFIKIDLSQPIDINEKFDLIIHIAAQINYVATDDYITNNLIATRNLVNFALQKRIDKIIYMSTFSVYGEVTGCIHERSARVNLNSYGMTKYLGELLLKEAELDVFTIRLPKVIGNGVNLNYPWIPLLTKKLLNNNLIQYYNPDLQYNNVIHVDDLVKFVSTILKKGFNGSKVVGLGSKESLSVLEIATLLKNALESKSKLCEISQHASKSCFQVSVDKAVQLGFNPLPIQDALLKFCQDIKLGEGEHEKSRANI